MFSRRTRWELGENRISRAVAERRSRGLPVADLTETNPTRVGLPFPADEILGALAPPGALAYAPEPFGLRSAREAVAARYGGAVPPERIALSASTSEAYAWLFKLLCDPGDRVLVPTPSYPLFEYLATLEAVELDAYPSHYADGWHLDVEALADAVTPRTRAVLVVSPNNPTGAVLRRGELARLAALCAKRSLALVCDEVFADWTFGADPELVPTLAGHDACLTFVLGGLSKSLLLPQLKLAWTLVQGPEALVREALARLEVVADSYLSLATPVQLAAPRLLALRERIQAPLRARLAANLAALGRASKGSATSVLAVDGGWCAVLRVPRIQTDEEWVLGLLESEGVLVHPGHFFDFASDGFLVVSLLPPEDEFQASVERVVRHVDAACGGADQDPRPGR